MNPYQGKVRLRVCGVLLEQNKLLLVKHRGLGKSGYFWSPPGGGVEFGESYRQALEREVLEETGLQVVTGDFIAFHEHIDERFHALELFFRLIKTGGELAAGYEPESGNEGPSIEEIRWFSLPELNEQKPETIHSLCKGFLGKA